jgi:hypothetical protein
MRLTRRQARSLTISATPRREIAIFRVAETSSAVLRQLRHFCSTPLNKVGEVRRCSRGSVEGCRIGGRGSGDPVERWHFPSGRWREIANVHGDPHPRAVPREPSHKTGPPSQCSSLGECHSVLRELGLTIRARMPGCGRGLRRTRRAWTISIGCAGLMGSAARCVVARRRGSWRMVAGRAGGVGGGCRQRRERSSTGRGRR